MTKLKERTMDEIIGTLERYALDHPGTRYIISFAEGDVYVCSWENGEYVDNDAEMGTSEWEEWYELDYRVLEEPKPGPNKDPLYRFIQVSEKHMPTSVRTVDGHILFDLSM